MSERFETLKETIRYCPTGDSLMELIPKVDAACLAGEITDGEVESLVREATQTSRVLIRGGVNVPAEFFIGEENAE